MSLVEEMNIDLICSDLEMKDGTGLDILTSLRKKYLEIPFILMSGKDDGLEIEMAKYHGAIFLSKTSYDFLMEIRKYR